jgi:hypothetical protein
MLCEGLQSPSGSRKVVLPKDLQKIRLGHECPFPKLDVAGSNPVARS